MDEVIEPMENLSLDGEIQEQSLKERCEEVCNEIRKIQKHFEWRHIDNDTFCFKAEWNYDKFCFEGDWNNTFTPQDARFVNVEEDALRILGEVKPGDGIDVSEIETFLHWKPLIKESIALHNEYYDLCTGFRKAQMKVFEEVSFKKEMPREEANQHILSEMWKWKDKMQVIFDKIKGNPYIDPGCGQNICLLLSNLD
jgi:hypothetical protein